MDGANSNTQLGFDFTDVGDLDANGSNDIAITSSRDYGSWIVYGPLTFDSQTLQSSSADAEFTSLRHDVAAAGDVNSDGYNDFWVGSESLYLLPGPPR